MLGQVSIRVSILTLLMALIGFVSVILLGLQYYFSLQLADKAAEQAFEQVADKLSVFIKEEDLQLKSIINLVSHNQNLGDFPSSGELHKSIDTFISMLETSTNAYAVYVGKENGDFYEVIHMQRFPSLHEKYKADRRTHWAVIHIKGEGASRVKNWSFYDEQLNRLGGRSELAHYDPRIRPWYTKALNNGVIRTEPYLFNILNASGITYAKTLKRDNGVLAIDVTMSALNDFLANQRFSDKSEVFLYDKHGNKYASSRPLSLGTNESTKLNIDVQQITLSQEEKQYVSKHPVLRVSNEIDWPPIDYATGGVPMGYSIDLLNLLADKLGFRLQFINGYTWAELLELFKNGKLDILHPAYWKEEREEFALFTEPLYRLKHVFVLRKGHNIEDVNGLKGKTIALPSGWAQAEYLRNHYPDINILEVPQSSDAYFAVTEGKADATIDHELAMKFNSAKYGLNNLTIGPWFKQFDNGIEKGLHIMVQKDQSILRDMLNKALAAVSPEELSRINNRWGNPACVEPADCTNPVFNKDNVVNRAFMLPVSVESSGLIRYDDEDDSYFAYKAHLETFNEMGHRLGLTEVSESFLAPFMKKVEISLNTTLIVLVLIIPIVLYASRFILKPIQALMTENEKVGKRHYRDVKVIKTHIKELRSLSESLIHMSSSIQAYEKAQEELMDSLIQLIADAIDAKSPYTAGHCTRVPEIAMMLAKVASDDNRGPFTDFSLETEDEWREFRIGAWLHDCGKVTTPEYVVDKATKLENITNRIHEVRTRFEVLWRDAEISCLTRQLRGEDVDALKSWLETEHQRLIDDFMFIADCNIGGEFMSDDKQNRLKEIADRTWLRHFDNRIGLSEDELIRFGDTPALPLPVEERLLSDKPEHLVPRDNFDEETYKAQGFKLEVPEYLYNYGELYNLSISRGTLTAEERFKINEHIIMTIRMLEQLPLPENMKRIPEYAGTHHETLIGTGYPRKLTKSELSIPARIMVLADIFEALTAYDRPYKKAKTLSEAIKIMGFMCKDSHIDSDVFKLFLSSGIYKEYASKYLMPDQLDDVDIESYMNCDAK